MILFPVKMFLKIIEKIRDQAWEEIYGEENIKQELLRLQLQLDMGEISEDEYNECEAVLMQRLEIALDAREE